MCVVHQSADAAADRTMRKNIEHTNIRENLIFLLQ
jgi:hypothetical protein